MCSGKTGSIGDETNLSLSQSLICITMISVSFSTTEQPSTFETYNIELGYDKFQTILSGDLSGNEQSEISVTSRDSLGNVTLFIYSLADNNWNKTTHTELSKSISFVDITNIGGRERNIFYENKRFYAFNPENPDSELLFSFSFSFTGKSGRRIPWWSLV